MNEINESAFHETLIDALKQSKQRFEGSLRRIGESVTVKDPSDPSTSPPRFPCSDLGQQLWQTHLSCAEIEEHLTNWPAGRETLCAL